VAVSFTTDQSDMYAMSIIMHLPMSEPSPIIEDPEPTAAPSPAEDPPGERARSRGFLVWPYMGL